MTENTRHETPDVAELRRLAEAATPGPWDYYRPHPNYRAYAVDRVMPGGHLGEDVATTGDVCAEENGAYIAAANPAAVLGLLDRLAHMTEARDNARAEVERLTALVEAVREDASDIARDSGDDKGCYGVDFWAGMCKAAARIDSRIRHALDGLSHVDYLDDDGRKQRGRAVRAEMEMERAAAERDALAAKVAALADWHETKAALAARAWDEGRRLGLRQADYEMGAALNMPDLTNPYRQHEGNRA